ncbi:pirin family protein [Novispirillum sp. DQ9]|uniref:pirin family protein n=1 Tax=Novispirillum sp. DQ9 TaxID=3398612 RepID=UPI003C7E18D0
MTTSPRSVVRIARGRATSDGAGVRLTRVLGHGTDAGILDPFLMLDEFGSEKGADYVGGFPDHPHRGMETVTIMFDGRMRHGDNKGHGGVIGPGGVQWMTAGRGIVHSEMPEQEDGLLRGLQLWVNLPRARKMAEPGYQNLDAADIPEVALPGGGRVRVIAGSFGGTAGAAGGIAADPLLLDLHLGAGEAVDVPVHTGNTAFAYVADGAADLGGTTVAAGGLAVLGDGDGVAVTATAPGTRLLVAAATPLNEPIAWYGPFVMNTQEEIKQAVRDYQAGRF